MMKSGLKQERSERGRRLRRRLRTAAGILLVNVLILLCLDWLLVTFNVLRPPIVYGDPDVGFFADRRIVTSEDLGVERDFPDSSAVTIAMIGDSHSELGPLDRAMYRHQFVFETALREGGVDAVILSAGRGRFAPLQEYMLYKTRIRDEYNPSVVVMNFYAGNDFYDMLRPDDRPYFVRKRDGSVRVSKPMWNSFADPEGRKWRNESRLLWVCNRVLTMAGYPKLFTRVRALTVTTRRIDGKVGNIVPYLRMVNRSIEPGIEYPAAFSAQILNQSLFFDFFPKGKDECLAFVDELMALARRENPDVLFVMAPIPSAVLTDAMPEEVAAQWAETLARTNTTNDAVRGMEQSLYDHLRGLSETNGWLFVDVLAAFRASGEHSGLYNSHDLHVTEAACRIIGEAEASTLIASGLVAVDTAEAR